MSSIFDLTGKTAFITGASSGIGCHISKTFAAYGANVILAARRTSRLQKVSSEIHSAGGQADWVQIDVTSKPSVERAFAKSINRFGSIDVVVNNAGIASTSAALDVTESDWDRVMDTNLKGAWLVAQRAGRHMSKNKKGGSIINIASILGLRVMGGVAPYAAAKAALDHLTRILAYEWARHQIRVNAIAPGYIYTDINRDYLSSPMGQKALQKIPQKRFGHPKDLDGTALLLASDASSYMTGSTIVVDGGHLQSSM